jgi:hypothetical protein
VKLPLTSNCTLAAVRGERESAGLLRARRLSSSVDPFPLRERLPWFTVLADPLDIARTREQQRS